MRVKEAPDVLVIHLKRFKVEEGGDRFVKFGCRIVFNLDLKFFDPVTPSSNFIYFKNDTFNVDKAYTLSSFIVHIGSSVDQGHYISIVKIMNEWVLFDDDKVEVISEDRIHDFYGDATNGCGYIFFYKVVS